ncbi:MAG: hypothetical protein J2P57_24285 [Acidimicrobiaceae bacterium]|nr:hypothetical protein [Acidimicrobiaceae bacterium]
MSLRADIHAALDPVVPNAPHLAYAVRDAIHEGRRPRRRPRHHLRLGTAIAMLGVGLALIVFAVVNTVLLTAGPAQLSGQAHSAVNGSGVRLVWTTWMKDPSVHTGSNSGERPQLVGLDSSSVTSARVARCGPTVIPAGAGGGGASPAVHDWCVWATLNAHGAEVLNTITSPAAAASVCPQACEANTPQHVVCPARMLCLSSSSAIQLTTWDNLTQDDIDHWAERATTLRHSPAFGGKFLGEIGVADQQHLLAGSQLPATVGGSMSHQDAVKLAREVETVNG